MFRLKSTIVPALITLTLSAVACLHAQDRMRTGPWEVTTTNEGKPASAPHSSCFTPAMVELANMPATAMREATEKAATQNGSCTVKDFKLDGNKISMTLSCGARSSAYSSTYSGESFETVITSTEAGARTVVQMKGRRIGDCK